MGIGDEQSIVFVEEILAELTAWSTGVVFTLLAHAARSVIRLSVANGIEPAAFAVPVTLAQATGVRLSDAGGTPRSIVVQIGTTFAIQTFGVMRTVAAPVDLRRE